VRNTTTPSANTLALYEPGAETSLLEEPGVSHRMRGKHSHPEAHRPWDIGLYKILFH